MNIFLRSPTAYLIEDTESDGNAVLTVSFVDSLAATHYIQRFGKPGWRVLPVNLLTLDMVRALPSTSQSRQVELI